MKYKTLLRKYMDAVRCFEGVTFADECITYGDMTDEEKAAIKKIDEEIEKGLKEQ